VYPFFNFLFFSMIWIFVDNSVLAVEYIASYKIHKSNCFTIFFCQKTSPTLFLVNKIYAGDVFLLKPLLLTTVLRFHFKIFVNTFFYVVLTERVFTLTKFYVATYFVLMTVDSKWESNFLSIHVFFIVSCQEKKLHFESY
jgi:hypothetical protein